MPEKTMFTFPKKSIQITNHLYHYIKSNPDKINNEHFQSSYKLYLNQLLDYSRKYLTNDFIASYILEKTGHENIKKILFLSHDLEPDYLRCSVLTGFKDLFGKDCHDYPKIPHIYKINNMDLKKLYGKGFTYSENINNDPNDNPPKNINKQLKRLYGKGFKYTENLNNDTRNDDLDLTLIKDIQNKIYDIVIYGALHRGLPFHDEIKQIYEPHEIIYLCGEDFHTCNPSELNVDENSFIFKREY
jgi:hypothetical protein